MNTAKEREDRKLVLTLADLTTGESAVVSRLHTEDRAILRRLIAMGILPGTGIALVRRSPAFVLSVGHARFAVDEALARRIYVTRGKR